MLAYASSSVDEQALSQTKMNELISNSQLCSEIRSEEKIKDENEEGKYEWMLYLNCWQNIISKINIFVLLL